MTYLPHYSRLRICFDLLYDAVDQGLDDDIPSLGAALAFYALLSAIPMLVLLIPAITALYGNEIARDQIYDLVAKFAGHRQAETIKGLLDSSMPLALVDSKTFFFSLAILVYGASSVFTQLQQSMNLIWKVPSSRKSVVAHFLKERLYSFIMVFAMGLVMIAAILANTLLTVAVHLTTGAWPEFAFGVQSINMLLNFCVLAAVFVLAFKIMPDLPLAWADVRGGAILTAFLFTLGQYAIGFYLGHAGFISAYGAAGSLVALLIWAYYSAQIFFFGAKFSYIYAHRLGSCRQEKQS